MDKVRVIEGSLRCFRLGLASLVPVIGLAFAVLAMMEAHRVRKEVGDGWNPVRGRLMLGRVFALAGPLLWLVIIPLLGVLLSDGF